MVMSLASLSVRVTTPPVAAGRLVRVVPPAATMSIRPSVV
jgi:hypothetical protein